MEVISQGEQIILHF